MAVSSLRELDLQNLGLLLNDFEPKELIDRGSCRGILSKELIDHTLEILLDCEARLRGLRVPSLDQGLQGIHVVSNKRFVFSAYLIKYHTQSPHVTLS